MPQEPTSFELTFQVGDLIAVSGAQRKTVFRWTESGILQPAPGTSGLGTGRHRRYGLSEMFIAAVLQDTVGFASVGTAVEIANAVRAQIFEAPEGGWTEEAPFRRAWHRVLAGSPASLLLCKRGDDLDVGLMLGDLADPDRKLLGIDTLKGYHPIVVIDLNETWRPVIDYIKART